MDVQGTLPVNDNPAFLLPHPTLPHVLYGTTECIHKNGYPPHPLQRHLAHKNPPPPMTLQKGYD